MGPSQMAGPLCMLLLLASRHSSLTCLRLRVGPGLMALPGWGDEVCRPRGAPFPGNSEDRGPGEWSLGNVLLGGKKDEPPILCHQAHCQGCQEALTSTWFGKTAPIPNPGT